MKIEFLYFKECPSYRAALDRLQKIVADWNLEAGIEKTEIFTQEGAKLHRFLGSPSIRIDGRDIERGEDYPGFTMSCRIYPDTGTGLPSEEMILKALKRKAG